jgi:hypothetical protein
VPSRGLVCFSSSIVVTARCGRRVTTTLRVGKVSVVKSMTSGPAYGPMAVMDRWCSCTSRHLLGLGLVLGLDGRLEARREDVDLAVARLGLGDVGDEVRAELAGVALGRRRSLFVVVLKLSP